MDTEGISQVRGAKVVDPNGDKIGKVEEIYLDKDTDKPEWALVNTGMFGSHSTFIPLQGSSRQGDDLQVSFDKEQVKDAPGVDAGKELSQSDEAELYRYYGLDYSEESSDSGLPEGGTGTGLTDTTGHDTNGPTTDDAMTRSEEELQVGIQQQEAGRELRKRMGTRTVRATETVRADVPATRGHSGAGDEPSSSRLKSPSFTVEVPSMPTSEPKVQAEPDDNWVIGPWRLEDDRTVAMDFGPWMESWVRRLVRRMKAGPSQG